MTTILSDDYLTEAEVCEILRITRTTIRARRSRGTEHPPYVTLRRGIVLYPKKMFLDWIGKRPIIWECKSAG